LRLRRAIGWPGHVTPLLSRLSHVNWLLNRRLSLPLSLSSFIFMVIVTVTVFFVVVVSVIVVSVIFVSIIVVSVVCAFLPTLSSCFPSLVASPSLIAPSLSHRVAPLLLPLSFGCIAACLSLDKDTNNDGTDNNNISIFLSSRTAKINPPPLPGMHPTKIGCCIINEVQSGSRLVRLSVRQSAGLSVAG